MTCTHLHVHKHIVWFVARKWFKVEVISTVSEPVRDIAFSPNLGRSYHMLAVASKDVHIFSLKPLNSYHLPVALFLLCMLHTSSKFFFTGSLVLFFANLLVSRMLQ